MQKKEYKTPKIKEIKLKSRANLLQSSDNDGYYHGSISHNDVNSVVVLDPNNHS
ncbi:MAG: hypothetical protein MJY99_03820 [Fibrobacter sp.]|nr:hypothetical protein [Fibrobacter sp.]